MPLSAQLTAFLKAAGQKSYPASDAIMSREISMAIKIGWTEEEVRERARKCVEILK